jgi:uncharacterized protein involved in exopolysaccharide biosynthesis
MIMQTTSNPDPLDDLGLLDLVLIAARRWRVVVTSAAAGGVAAFLLSMLIAPQFTAKVTFLPPQSSAGSGIGLALQSLGPLASMAAGGLTGKASGDLYVSFLGSETILDRMIARFKLRQLYKADYQFEARDILKNRTRVTLGKRDGLIAIEVDDVDPKRAAAMATQYVDELRQLTAGMALTEAQRKRVFFQGQLETTRTKLAEAQAALQASGFNQGALRSEPRAAAEEYARVMEELTATEVQQSAQSSRLASGAPEMLHLQATAAALRARLQAIEKQSTDSAQSQDYIGKYRDFKYQETLYDALSKQFEAARLEESKDDNLIQVVDPAQVPEWKSKPKRSMYALAGMLLAGLVASVVCIVAGIRRHANQDR